MTVYFSGFNWRGIRFGVLMPWLLLLLMVCGLIEYRVWQQQKLEDFAHHTELHRQAIYLSERIRTVTQENFLAILLYEHNPRLLAPQSIREGENEIETYIGELTTLFIQYPHDQYNEINAEELTRVTNFSVSRIGLTKLYKDFLNAVDIQAREQQKKLLSLIVSKQDLVNATLTDLTIFHAKTAKEAEYNLLVETRRMETLFFGLLLSLAVAGLTLAYFQTRAIAKPLIRLTEAAGQIERGEKVSFAGFGGHSEIASLAQAFAQMVASLHRSNQELSIQREELRQAYDDVESKVKQRTAELKHRSEDLEDANKDLANFSYSVSHDLRAPLRAIDGFITILKEDYEEQLDAEGIRLFGIVQDNAHKMGQLIDDILQFSRAGRAQLEFVNVDMAVLVGEVWDGLREQRGQRSIEFLLDELPVCQGDIRALRQVWQNLLSNAVKFTNKRDVAHIRVSGEIKEGWVCYQVKDDGAGFNPDYADKLFILFQRLHDMDEFEGTGVGLAIVKRFLQKHGGDIKGQGEIEAGAVFYFRLPEVPRVESVEYQESRV